MILGVDQAVPVQQVGLCLGVGQSFGIEVSLQIGLTVNIRQCLCSASGSVLIILGLKNTEQNLLLM